MKKLELYLIIDGDTDFKTAYLQVEKALKGGVNKIQLGNPGLYSSHEISQLLELSHTHGALFLIHQDLKFALDNACDGVHFDSLPPGYEKVKKKDFLVGVTVGNDENKIREATKVGVDYISFCSLFPTSSAPHCEIVKPEVILATAKKYNIPIYVAGGIKKQHLNVLKYWPIAGVAMISEITKAKDITQTVIEIKQNLEK